MRDRQGAQHRSSRLLRPTRLQALLLVLIGAGLIAGVRQRQHAVCHLVPLMMSCILH